MISEVVLAEKNTERVWFLFLSRDFLNSYLHGELFLLLYCHLPNIFTGNLPCLNIHLNCLPLDNNLVPKPQCNVMWQWHDNGDMWHSKPILNLAGWSQIRRDQNEWSNHHLDLIRSQFIIIYFYARVMQSFVRMIYVRQAVTSFLFEVGPL